MSNAYTSQLTDSDPQETQEWQQAIDQVTRQDGPARAQFLLAAAMSAGNAAGMRMPPIVNTPYINTIAPALEPRYPGDLDMERKVRAMLRWNAAAMVSRANKNFSGIGGHISSYASSAGLYEMGFNHFFRGPKDDGTSADQIFYQGHAVPGIYARAYLEGRLTEDDLDMFRRQCAGGGLSSYPHPWLQPDFWQFPTVSMGLGPIHAIYQARFNRYLSNRGLKDTQKQRVWAFLGDGECDEVEALGALTVASREGLNNLTFVINCNLQRLDGPVRGNGKIVQELEATFTGAGWEVIKVLWGPEWDPLIAADHDGTLTRRLGEVVDGQYQRYTINNGAFMREELFGVSPELLARVKHLSDEDLARMRRGGHSDVKLHAAYNRAIQSDKPVCILAKTVKGWTLGNAFEASNVTHQMKKMDTEQLLKLRDRLQLPIKDEDAKQARYYHPGKNSEALDYMRERRRQLGGSLPFRKQKPVDVAPPTEKTFQEFKVPQKALVEVSTTMACVRLLRALMRDKKFGKRVVPIIPDEARTFGMDAFFREFGIYAPFGQKYTPIDSSMLLNYHEAQNGQLLEEGITEAGSMASFMAAATSYATHGTAMVPFYMFYSMFGLQRTGDQVWSVGDARGRGFLLGATAGRTTLHGEGLQHNDGHSHLLAHAVPNLLAYDPAFAFEVATIVQSGLERMLKKNEDVFYYITLYNENYPMPVMPNEAQPKAIASVEEGIIKGMYRFKSGPQAKVRAQLWGSGPMLQTVLAAQKILFDDYKIGADVWSITSYQQLYRDGRKTERHNRLRPDQAPSVPFAAKAVADAQGPIVAVSDWVSELPAMLSPFVPKRMIFLGTNGFGRSDTREALRQHFEIDVGAVITSTLYALLQEGHVDIKTVNKAYKQYGINPDKRDPMEM